MTVDTHSSSPTQQKTNDSMSSTKSQSNIASSTTPASKQKLKLSCDTCASLKVACPKQQPECERCLSKGRRCTYSLANRNGKRKRSKAQGPNKNLPTPPERWIWQTPSPLALPDNEDAMGQRGPTLSNNAIPELPELVANNTSVLTASLTDGLSFTTSSLQEALWQSADHPMTSVEPSDIMNTSHPYQEVSMYQCPDSYFSSAYIRPMNRWPRQPTSPLFTPASSYLGEASIDSSPSSGSACSYSPTADVEAALLVNSELPQLPPQPQDNCFTRTYLLLHTLKRPSGNVCMFESSDLPSPYIHNTIQESIDKILVNTDKAIEHVTSVMRCSCHTTSSVRCALTLVLFEVISWYETMIREFSQQQQQQQQTEKFLRDLSPWSSSDEGYNSGSTSQRARSVSGGSMHSGPVAVPTISIGNMQLPQADAMSVLSQIVLSRVGKVRGIVQNLSTDCTVSMEGMQRLDNVTDGFVKLQKGKISL